VGGGGGGGGGGAEAAALERRPARQGEECVGMGQQAGMGVGGCPLGHRLTMCPEDGDCMPSEVSPGQLVESM